MGINRGKQFEGQIRKALEKYPNSISSDRFADPMAGYAGIRNICDFGVYSYPNQFYFECKSFCGNTLNFKSDITKDQWEGLKEKSIVHGVHAGILAWFIDHDITVYVSIRELVKLRDSGEKSLNIKHIRENSIKYYIVPSVKKRVLFEYDMWTFLNILKVLNDGEE